MRPPAGPTPPPAGRQPRPSPPWRPLPRHRHVAPDEAHRRASGSELADERRSAADRPAAGRDLIALQDAREYLLPPPRRGDDEWPRGKRALAAQRRERAAARRAGVEMRIEAGSAARADVPAGRDRAQAAAVDAWLALLAGGNAHAELAASRVRELARAQRAHAEARGHVAMGQAEGSQHEGAALALGQRGQRELGRPVPLRRASRFFGRLTPWAPSPSLSSTDAAGRGAARADRSGAT